MQHNLRKHGHPPFHVAVIHGGPGAAGAMAPVARELARGRGVLEPLQTAASIDGQVAELLQTLRDHAAPPVTLVGHSWGAWLALILAARHPEAVRKLILVGCGPFEERYAHGIMETRLARLREDERHTVQALLETLREDGGVDQADALERLGALIAKADAYEPLSTAWTRRPRPHSQAAAHPAIPQGEIFQRVWAEASALRASGELLRLARAVRCPVTALHGDHDPHPAVGVEEPLSHTIPDFRFILLERCGHTPWLERQARGRYFEILKEELAEISDFKFQISDQCPFNLKSEI